MSSILKAIRKIEDEKRVGENKAPDLMIDHGRTTSNGRSLLLTLVSGAFLGAVLVGTLFFLLQDISPEVATVDQPEPPVAAENNKVAVKVLADREGFSQEAASSVPSDISEVSKVTELASEGGQKIAPEKQPEVKSEITRSSVAQDAPDKEEQIVAPPKAVITVPAVAAAKPVDVSLKVSEIFYQEDSANSMAVVNDLPVMIGTHVDNAIVKAIHQGEVIFEISGQSLVVPVSKP